MVDQVLSAGIGVCDTTMTGVEQLRVRSVGIERIDKVSSGCLTWSSGSLGL